MASQGQRFRRRALRRGYKVDEVDAFLDRVEATLAGEPVGQPVGAQEVHDVVFRVRFGGYDEWQVDLHLDRVERQIGELEERNGRFAGPDRMGLPDRMGPAGPPDALGPPPGARMGGPGMGPPDRMGPPIAAPPPGAYGPPDRRAAAMGGGPLPTRPLPNDDPYARPGPPPPYGAGPFDGPPRGYDGPGGPGGPMGPPGGGPAAPPMRGGGGPGFPPGDDGYDGYDGPEQHGRRGRMDMTAEIRMPERGDVGRGAPAHPGGGGPGMGGGPGGPGGPGMGGPGLAMGGVPGGGMGGPGMGGPPLMGPPGSDLARVDQMRRSFQVRRFGSGYDPSQVDRFFEDVLTGMTGRGPIPTTDADFDAAQFGLVPGGYFEAEVEQALLEVRDIVRRR